MARDDEYRKHRILYISPIGVALVVTVATLGGLSASEFFRTVGNARSMDPEVVVWGTVAALLGSVISAFAFNLVAPMVGGFPLWVSADKTAREGRGEVGEGTSR